MTISKHPTFGRNTLAATALAALLGMPTGVAAGEGGTSHILPGGNATLVDLPPTTPGFFFKPMFLH